MSYSFKEIVARIEAHFKKRGGGKGEWFVGLGSKAWRSLRSHGVQRKGDHWIYMRASSLAAAKEAKDYLAKRFEALGAQSPRGEIVYAYKLSSRTKP